MSEAEQIHPVVWVIGGTTGIGEAVADNLENNLASHFPGMDGADLIKTDKRVCDVTSLVDVHDKVRSMKPTHVVYSAGITRLDWISQYHPQDFVNMLQVNVIGFANVMNALAIRETRWPSVTPPSVVAISSDAANRPMRTSLAYCASKAALDMAIRVAARELAPKGWRVNGVAPGKVADTPMTDYVDRRVLEVRGWTKEFADSYEKSSSNLPGQRPVTKEEVAEVVRAVLFGPPALNGVIVPVNGGR